MITRLVSALRTSLAIRVVALTTTLFTISAGVIGTVIFLQIEDRITNSRIESSISEAQSTIAAAEFRFELIQSVNPESISDSSLEEAFNQVMALAIAPGATVSAREIALIKSIENEVFDLDLTRTSNFVQPESIPESLRGSVETGNEIVWESTEIIYAAGNKVPGIAIGKRVNVPYAGSYEMYVLFNFEAQEDSIAIIARGLLIAFFLVFVLILLMATLIVQRVVDPIKRVAEVAESFTAGDLSQRVQVAGEDEIAALGRSFNEMAFAIEQQISRLENLSRMQQRFVSDVSHELRNPMTTIRMAGEVIVGQKESFDPVIARSAEILMTQIVRFDQLLTDLLEVSRFDAAVATLDYSEIELEQLLRETIDSLDANPSRFVVSGNATLSGDRRRITRILRNLLSNALDHGEGKEIVISIAPRQSSVDVGVRDFGMGLSEDQFDRVFERFWRADPARSREHGGTGLGLSIALEDAKLHGGSLRVFGQLGSGALFLLTLPFHSGQPVTDPPIDIVQQFRSLG
jgi:two-component system, OmpR family, sensor histidine kinase MtrB